MRSIAFHERGRKDGVIEWNRWHNCTREKRRQNRRSDWMESMSKENRQKKTTAAIVPLRRTPCRCRWTPSGPDDRPQIAALRPVLLKSLHAHSQPRQADDRPQIAALRPVLLKSLHAHSQPRQATDSGTPPCTTQVIACTQPTQTGHR
jgi:hypothetical protein